MDVQNYKMLFPKDFDFCELLKMREKILTPKFFFLLFYRRENAKRLRSKDEIQDKREAP